MIKNEKPCGNYVWFPLLHLRSERNGKNRNATLQRDSFKFFNFFFNKMASIAESIMAFVMLHNTGIKCE